MRLEESSRINAQATRAVRKVRGKSQSSVRSVALSREFLGHWAEPAQRCGSRVGHQSGLRLAAAWCMKGGATGDKVGNAREERRGAKWTNLRGP